MEQLKVLIVDDEPGIRSGIIRILQNFHVNLPFLNGYISFDLDEAECGEEAVKIIDREHPDIILLDNKLGGMQGIEVLEYINEKQLDSHVIMITAYASLDMAVKATHLGAYDFISKPFTPIELRASLENLAKHLYLLRMTRKMTEEGKHLRFQFLSVLSHELKAPLNAIEGYLRMMKDKTFYDNIDDYMTIIERALQRVGSMRVLIMDLLDLTRIEGGSKTRDLQNLNVCSIARDAIDTMNPLAIQKDVKVTMTSGDNIYMYADAKEIEIIFNNLISNAVKYNKDGGEVEISVAKENELVSIMVSDSGIGMTEEELAKLFNEFVRIKNPKTKNISGTGLGLSIVKKISELYDGDVKVTSSPDKGTTFRISLQDYQPANVQAN